MRPDGPRQTPLKRARKEFGQHFLERAWVDKVIRAVAPAATETFIEIGPGRGALTRPLADRAARVVAFEIDRELAVDLREELRDEWPNVHVVQGDFLATGSDQVASELRVPGQAPGVVRVAGNLPYNVASPIMFRLVALHAQGLPLADATLMLQREVADRLLAPPGSRTYGVLSVLIQHRASVERLLTLPPGAFRPPPKVHSAVVRLRFHAPDPVPVDQAVFEALTQAVFTRRRKILANALLAYPGSAALAPGEALATAGIDGVRRPETLTIAELVALSDVYARRAAAH